MKKSQLAAIITSSLLKKENQFTFQAKDSSYPFCRNHEANPHPHYPNHTQQTHQAQLELQKRKKRNYKRNLICSKKERKQKAMRNSPPLARR
jgi:hypothetical protein